MCNGDWEHTYGIEISNIDNPGWQFIVELEDTPLHGIDFKDVEININHDTEWAFCRVENGKFDSAGGPKMLGILIKTFLDWAEANTPSNNHN